jgi:hypothetical protein
MENSSGTIGNLTRDLPACSTVPQLTAPPAACPFLPTLLVEVGPGHRGVCLINVRRGGPASKYGRKLRQYSAFICGQLTWRGVQTWAV